MGKVILEAKKKAGKTRKVAHISIEPGENKSVVVHHREHGGKPTGKAAMMGMLGPRMGPEKQQAFGSPEDAKDHVNGLIGDLEPPEEGNPGY